MEVVKKLNKKYGLNLKVFKGGFCGCKYFVLKIDTYLIYLNSKNNNLVKIHNLK
tara:strand:+ start:698 stop:859 length:162 start_codon:yes stop_codon:yes gene_type:complete